MCLLRSTEHFDTKFVHKEAHLHTCEHFLWWKYTFFHTYFKQNCCVWLQHFQILKKSYHWKFSQAHVHSVLDLEAIFRVAQLWAGYNLHCEQDIICIVYFLEELFKLFDTPYKYHILTLSWTRWFNAFWVILDLNET